MDFSKVIRLDIGGTVFKTSQLTLIKYDCMFRGMLESGIPFRTDESGCIFIDRDPTYFRFILNFMRDGTVELPKDSTKIKEILKEAEYYSIQGLIDLCENPEPTKDYRVVKNSAELITILINATRDVLVITFPVITGGPSLDHAQINTFIQKHKHRIDIVFAEFAGSFQWRCDLHPLDRLESKYFGSGNVKEFFGRRLGEIDEKLSNM